DSRGDFPRGEAVYRLQKKAVRAARIVLKRGGRVAAGGKRVRPHDGLGRFRATGEPIGGCPSSAPAVGAGWPGAGGEGNCRGGGRFVGAGDEAVEDSQIMFRIVDGVAWVRWRRPTEPRFRCRLSAAPQLSKIRQPAFRRPDRFKRIE